ncbi:hypothetical protein ADUPG1_006689 [Aduncisulcus paluster]|uniref:Guanylate-binding protein N-terminal domain-containing protein n=1 Tax=Aduncisulcus paluster TaxID=2918883 RepID=A0ABQ5KJ65_9EUKA|nr:hypothetical protein ADUPG1_006689 [Aduncisulcus paluster]
MNLNIFILICILCFSSVLCGRKGSSSNLSAHSLRAIPLIEVIESSDKINEFRFSDEAKEFIQSISSPIAVITPLGNQRCGKSYMMNQLGGLSELKLKKELMESIDDSDIELFAVLDSVKPVTRGVWVFGTPVCFKSDASVSPFEDCDPDNDVPVLLLDTEGGDSTERGNGFDKALFTLSLSISSIILYNSDFIVNSSEVDKIEIISLLSSNIFHSVSSASTNNNSEHSFLVPDFIWTIQKSFLQWNEEVLVERKEYLLNELEEVSHNFHSMDIQIFPPATSDTQYWGKLSNIPQEELSPLYIASIEKLRKSIFDIVSERAKYGDLFISGRFLSQFIDSFVSALNKTDIPDSVPYLDALRITVVKNAVEDYVQYMEKIDFPIFDDEFEQAHLAALEVAKVELSSPIFGAYGQDKDLMDMFEKAIEQEKKEFDDANIVAAFKQCGVVSRECINNISSLIASHTPESPVTIRGYENELKKCVYQFTSQCQGPIEMVLSARYNIQNGLSVQQNHMNTTYLSGMVKSMFFTGLMLLVGIVFVWILPLAGGIALKKSCIGTILTIFRVILVVFCVATFLMLAYVYFGRPHLMDHVDDTVVVPEDASYSTISLTNGPYASISLTGNNAFLTVLRIYESTIGGSRLVIVLTLLGAPLLLVVVGIITGEKVTPTNKNRLSNTRALQAAQKGAENMLRRKLQEHVTTTIGGTKPKREGKNVRTVQVKDEVDSESDEEYSQQAKIMTSSKVLSPQRK